MFSRAGSAPLLAFRILVVLITLGLAACRGKPAMLLSAGEEAAQDAGQNIPAEQIVPAVTLSAATETPAAVAPTASATSVVQAEQAAPPAMPTPAFHLCSPLEIHSLQELEEIISDPYNPPPPGREERHHGVDFSYYRHGERLSIQGVGVQSVLAGRVAASLADSFPYGNIVIVETPAADLPGDWLERLGGNDGESLYVLYAHLEGPPQVSLGHTVDACQGLGAVGMSGNAGIAHLHLETRLGPPGAVFAQMQYYDTRATQEQRETYELWRTSGVFRHFNPMDMLTPDPGK